MARLNGASRQTWFDPSELGSSVTVPDRDSALERLWRGFMTARLVVATALLLLQILQYMLSAGKPWSLLLCLGFLAAVLFVRLAYRPHRGGRSFDHQWKLTIGLDIAVFGLLQMLQSSQSQNYAPLMALPVLMGSVMGAMPLALGTAAAVTLYLLGQALHFTAQLAADSAPALLQAGLTGIGYFAVAILANQLSTRLLREEELTRRGQRAIQLQTKVNELVIEKLSNGVVVVDPGGVVRAANPAARRLLAPEQRPMEPPFALTLEPGWKPLHLLVHATFANRTHHARDLVIEHPGEAPRRVHVRTRLTTTDDEAHGSLCVVFLEDLPELEAKLRQEKLLAMGRMSAAVAHEIRNPLAAITQANALLAEELQLPAQQKLTTMIHQNARRLARIVDDVLNVARVPGHGAERAANLELDAAVRRITLDWCQQNRSANRTLLALHAPETTVPFDGEHLRRVLVNLLDNAARYSGQQPDSIRVSTHSGDDEEGPWLAARLSVWSDGQALDPTVQAHLFEPFFSSESRSSGLGLYICRELCERHGAQLRYRRETSDAAARQVEGNSFFILFNRTRSEAGDFLPSTL